ncbi:pilus assembly protein PilB [Solibacillus silvestris]|nr:pilus assembly protein PilB [Solibacillus silvestris]OBW59376.1 pilus assembly protein PilB [Solibacillus silvestris]
MRKISIAKMLFDPIIVALVTTLSIVFIEGVFRSEIMPPSTAEKILLAVLLYLGIYLFTIIFVVPIEVYLNNRIKNKILFFVITNVIGLILVWCIDFWLGGFMSIYLIFPLFSILTLIRFNSDAK